MSCYQAIEKLRKDVRAAIEEASSNGLTAQEIASIVAGEAVG